MNRRLLIVTPLMMVFFILVLSSFTGEGTVGLTTVLGALKDPGIGASSANGPICISDALLRISGAHGIPPKLVQAIIQVESQGNPKAVSPRGALGLMQLMPEVIEACQVADPFDPLANIRAGVRHLHYLLLQFSGNLSLALAAYNAGAGAVRHYGGIPPYPETRKYLQSVLREYQNGGNELEMFVPILPVKLESIENAHERNYRVRGSNELIPLLQNSMTAAPYLGIP